MADRVTQKVAEAVYTPTPTDRVTQKVAEAVYTPTTRNVRVTQRVIEVIYQESSGVAPSLLGPAVTFAPQIDQQVQIPLLGPAVLFEPTVITGLQVLPDLLGSANLFAPSVQIFQPALAQGGVGGSSSDSLVARTHIWYQDDGWQSPLFIVSVNEDQSVTVPLLGGAQVFAPRLDQEVRIGLLGPAVIFDPVISGPVLLGLLGPAVLFTPTVSYEFVPAVHGPHTTADLRPNRWQWPRWYQPEEAQPYAQAPDQTVYLARLGSADLFAPSIVLPVVYPDLLGAAQVFAPAVLSELAQSICGPYSGPVEIRYDGVDITACVLFANTTFRSSAGATPGDALVRVKDAGQILDFTPGRSLTLKINGQREWTGFVSTVRRGYFFNGTPTSPGDTVRYFELAGVDLNIFFQKRVLYHKTTPTTVQLTTYPAGTSDKDILEYYAINHTDLVADGIDFSAIEEVGTPSSDDEISGQGGETWGEFVTRMRFNTGAIDYIDPDGVYQHVDDDTATAPFAVSDSPLESTFSDDFSRTVSPGIGLPSVYDPEAGEANSSVDGSSVVVSGGDSYWIFLEAISSGTIQFDIRIPDLDTNGYYYEFDFEPVLINGDWFASAISAYDNSATETKFELFSGISTGPSIILDTTPGAWYTVRMFSRPEYGTIGFSVWPQNDDPLDEWLVEWTAEAEPSSPWSPIIYLGPSTGQTARIDNIITWSGLTVLGPDAIGVRDLEIDFDGSRLRNDVMIWGAGQGSQNVRFARVQDSTSIAAHGIWQIGQYMPSVWRQTTVDRIADTYVHGSPQNRRGGKDDAPIALFTTFEQGLRAAQKVVVRSDVFGFAKVLPIRQVAIDFPTPTDPRWQITASELIDDPWSTSEFWFPDIDFRIDPPRGPVLPQPPSFDECSPSFCLLDTFQRTEPTVWGQPDIGSPWQMSGSGTNTRVDYRSGVLIDLDSETGPVTHNETVTNFICLGNTHTVYIAWSASAGFYSTGGLTETLFDDGENYLWPNLNNDPTPVQQYFAIHVPQVNGLGTHILYVTTDGAGTGYVFPSKFGTIYRAPPITFNWSPNTRYVIGISFDGPQQLSYYRVKIWPESQGEPYSWGHTQISAPTINSSEISISGSRVLETGESADPVELYFHQVQMLGRSNQCVEYFDRTVSGSWGGIWQQNVFIGAQPDVEVYVSGGAAHVDGPDQGGTLYMMHWADALSTSAFPLEVLWEGVRIEWNGDSDNWDVIVGLDAQPDPMAGNEWCYLEMTEDIVSGGGFFHYDIVANLTTSEAGGESGVIVWSSADIAIGNDPFVVANLNIRLRIESNAVYARVWEVGDTEPGTWTLEDTSTDESPIDGQLVSVGMQSGMKSDGVDRSLVQYDKVSIIEGCVDVCAVPATAPAPDPPTGPICEVLTQIATPSSYNPNHTYWQSSGDMVAGTVEAWLQFESGDGTGGGLFLRPGVDFYEGPGGHGGGNFIIVDESVDVTGKSVYACYIAEV